jgi:hypothetical protein
MRQPLRSDPSFPIVLSGPGGDYQFAWRDSDIFSWDGKLGFFGLMGNLLGLLALLPARTFQTGVKILIWSAQTDPAGQSDPFETPNPVGRLWRPLACCDGYALTKDGWSYLINRWREIHEPDETQEPGRIGHPYAATVTDTPLDRRSSPQRWLFADLAGTGRQPEHKQDNGIRARRSPRRKRAIAPSAQQGALFND